MIKNKGKPKVSCLFLYYFIVWSAIHCISLGEEKTVSWQVIARFANIREETVMNDLLGRQALLDQLGVSILDKT